LGSLGFVEGSFHSSISADAAGAPAVQAGSHPYAVTTSFKFRTRAQATGELIPDEGVKDIEVELPAGLVGNPNATPKCTFEQFNTPHGLSGATCPDDSQIGVAELELGTAGSKLVLGIYNLVTPPGAPGEFGVNAFSVPIVLIPKVRTGGDYGVTVASRNTNQGKRIFGVKTTFWGVPSASSHDGERGACLGFFGAIFAQGEENPCPVETTGVPFLRLPTSCEEAPLATRIYADSWQNPVDAPQLTGLVPPAVVEAETVNQDAEGHGVSITGCEHLDFSPTVNVQPGGHAAGSPAGASVEVSLPQNEAATGLGEADLKNVVVSLPAGISASPSAANGLEGCSEAAIGLASADAAGCPEASKVGTVEIETPLLEHTLEGSVYLAQPNANKFHSLLALYVVAEGSGVLLKLAGEAHADPQTGQLTTRFENNPQQPFSHLRLKLFNGPRATLMTPRRCGTYQVTGALTPWSSATPVMFSSPIEFNSDCGGGFAPSLQAGTITNQGAGFSPLSLTLARSDQDQALKRLSLRTPPGLLGMISRVSLCEEPHIAQQTCPQASQIGHVTLSAGAGSEPVYLPEPGHPEDPVYLTSGYNGAPFGLLTLVHAEAGPFNLGVVAVRSTLNVERRTSRILATTDPFPTILQGIPVDLKSVNILLDKEGFIFNPTNCAPLQFEGAVLSDEGNTAPVSSRFQAANCTTLPFHPVFKASTKAHATRANGASLTVKVGYPKGTQANIAGVKVSLPKQLPSRLTTLQKACPEATFAANPATCPPESLVGTAIANTPVLNVPVAGPAYLVSHGGAAFPDLVLILQGQGITVELVGGTFVSKAGITTSTFSSVPDVPISSFELSLPQGPHSALTENLPKKTKGNFCSSKLLMPTVITAQNGLQIKQSTKVAITGCPKKAKVKKKAKAKTK